MLSKLPDKKGTIGVREIVKGIAAGKIKMVVVAKNCPADLVTKVSAAKNINVDVFEGDEQQLGTAFGKPFPIAMVGYE